MEFPLPKEPPTMNITGEKVGLGPIKREYVPLYAQWINDFEVTRTLGMPMRPLTDEMEADWFDAMSRKTGEALFTIFELETMRPIGTTALHDLNHYHRRCKFGLMIGEKSCWGKGYGTEAASLALDYGFNALGLHNILLEAFSFNQPAIRAYTKAGFKEIGRHREAHRVGGRAYDIILMDCLATEFESRVMHRYLPNE